MKRALSLIAGCFVGVAASPQTASAYDIRAVNGTCPQGSFEHVNGAGYLESCRKQDWLVDAYHLGPNGGICNPGYEPVQSNPRVSTQESWSTKQWWCIKKSTAMQQTTPDDAFAELAEAARVYRCATQGICDSEPKNQSGSATSLQSIEIASAPTTPFELMNGAKLLSVGEKVDPAPIAVGVPVKGCPTYSATKQISSTGSASDCEIVSKVYVAEPEQVNGYPSCKTMWMLDPYSKKCFRVNHS